jgi:hypothetical protein
MCKATLDLEYHLDGRLLCRVCRERVIMEEAGATLRGPDPKARTRRRRIIWLSAAVIFVTLSVAYFIQRRRLLAEGDRVLAVARDRLHALSMSLPIPGGKSPTKACDDGVLRQLTHTSRHDHVEADVLRQPTSYDRSWNWLSGQRLAQLSALVHRPDLESETDRASYLIAVNAQLEAMGTVVVLIATEKRMPRIVGSKEFLEGVYSGYVLVADYATGRALCWAPLTASSSPHVTALVSRGGDSTDAQYDLEKDFTANVLNAAKNTLGTMTQAVRIDTR